MANKFQFKLFTSSDPQAQYDAITTKDAYTFYLLGNGVGYLGDIPLFGGDAEKFNFVINAGALTLEAGKLYVVAVDGVTVGSDTIPQGVYYSADGSTVENITYKTIAQYIADKAIKDMTADGYTGTDDTLATTKAIVDYVKNVVNNQSILEGKFFKEVARVKLTQDDIDGVASSPNVTTYGAIFSGVDNHVDDIGLVFTLDATNTASDDSDDVYVFVNLHELMHTYTVESSDSITMTETPDGSHGSKFKAELKVNSTEKSIVVDSDGVHLEKATSINDGDGTDSTPEPSADKLVTEEALVNYVINSVLPAVDAAITEALKDVVTYSVDDGTTTP